MSIHCKSLMKESHVVLLSRFLATLNGTNCFQSDFTEENGHRQPPLDQQSKLKVAIAKLTEMKVNTGNTLLCSYTFMKIDDTA